MNQVAKVENFELPPLAPQSESAAMLLMIERMARDPTIDIARLEKILELRDRAAAQAKRDAFDEAFALMQPELPVISEKGEIKVGNEVRGRYAKWEDIGDAVMPIIGRHGFTLRHRIVQTETRVTIAAILSRSGHSEECTVTLPIDTSGSKNAVQAIGSSTSYGQRYTTKAILNLRSRYVEHADDDGNAAGRTVDTGTIGMEKGIELIELAKSIHGKDINLSRFYKYYKIENMADLPSKRLAEATADLKRKD